MVSLVTHIQDPDRGSIVIFDDRQAIDLEPSGMLPALLLDIPAVCRLDVLAHRRLFQPEAEGVILTGRRAKSHLRSMTATGEWFDGEEVYRLSLHPGT